jgi:TolA-binding protein
MEPISVLANIPWSDLIKHAPKVLEKAKTLFSSTKPIEIDPNTAKVPELTAAIKKMENQLHQHAEVAAQLAIQNQAQFDQIKAIEGQIGKLEGILQEQVGSIKQMINEHKSQIMRLEGRISGLYFLSAFAIVIAMFCLGVIFSETEPNRVPVTG